MTPIRIILLEVLPRYRELLLASGSPPRPSRLAASIDRYRRASTLVSWGLAGLLVIVCSIR